MADQATLHRLLKKIAAGDAEHVHTLLAADEGLAKAQVVDGATRQAPAPYFLTEINHYIYAGDSALHLAAAAYQIGLAQELMRLGAEVRVENRRGAQPLHYAVDGNPNSRSWNPVAQSAIVGLLIERGADPNARDKSGVTPLHRAVRNRCAEAVRVLIGGGADVRLENRGGSSPLFLATQQTGRGGSGSSQAKAQQDVIVRLLESALRAPGP